MGGGLSGLATAHYLGGNCVVLEAGEEPGGLCRSFNKGGFVYDIGGHILFSKNQDILNEMVGWLGDNVERKYRRNQIWYKGRYVKYPFENGLAALDKEEIYECLISFLYRRPGRPRNLEEWFYCRFGKGMADKYLLPYNRKIWKRDLEKMSTLWVDRVPDPAQEDVVKSAIGIETEGYTHQLNFFYPRRDGINALIKSLLRYVPDVQTGFRVKKIRFKNGRWEISNDVRSVLGERIISTIPIFDLIGALDNVPERVKDATRKLQYNSLILVMIGVKHEGLSKKTALYVPDPSILPHRVCFMKYFSQFNAPEGYSHLVAEISVPPGDRLLEMDDDFLVEMVRSDLKELCDFSEDDIVAADVKRLRYAYVVYDLDYEKNTKIIYDYLGSLGINCAGRFGSFKYLNMDMCVQMAKDLVHSLS